MLEAYGRRAYRMDVELLDYEIPPCKYMFEYLQVLHALETGVT